MASATAPSTPEQNNTPRRIAMNRSFTVPPKLSASTRTKPTAEIGAANGIETLYVHPSANVIKFSTSSPSSRPSSSSGRVSSGAAQAKLDEAGTLPWASPTERTMAAGPLEIYRVPGSVSFLHSGSLLHAILPRSQCWCVDGVSKFAFRVLPDTYYRIELPGETPEDLESVESLKVTLKKVLWYERTPCPFKRSFIVNLPENAELSVKKNRRKSSGPAKKWKLARAYSWKPEDGEERPGRNGSVSSEASSSEESDAPAEIDLAQEKAPSEEIELADEVKELAVNTPTRPKGLAAMRSVTAPPQLSLHSTPPSKLRTTLALDGTAELDEIAGEEQPSEADMVETTGGDASDSNVPDVATTLRPFQPIPTDMPPSPPDSSAGAEYADSIEKTHPQEEPAEDPLAGLSFEERVQRLHAEAHGEEFTPTRAAHIHTTQRTATAKADSAPSTPNPTEVSPTSPETAWEEIRVPPEMLRLRRQQTKASKSSVSSSNSSSSTISALSKRSTSQHRTQNAFASALVRKTCAIFLGPPAHLVAIMLRIAARFANGAFHMNLVIQSPPGAVKRIPGSWDLAEELGSSDEEEEAWEEDDYGVPLTSPVRLMAIDQGVDPVGAGARERRGWELD